MAQMTREAANAGVDAEIDSGVSALLQTLGAWQAKMGVCAFANAGMHSMFLQIWNLMFVCTNVTCRFANRTALVCCQRKKTVPALRDAIVPDGVAQGDC
eukprot:1608090-Alexandrium_andersonii.AAC.1